MKSVLKKAGIKLEKLGKVILQTFVVSYKTAGASHMGGQCRFHPSCSEYALEAINKYNFWKASSLIFQRLIKCRPGGPYGIDLVPQEQKRIFS